MTEFRVLTEDELRPVIGVLAALEWPVPFDIVPDLLGRLGWGELAPGVAMTDFPVSHKSVSLGNLSGELSRITFCISDALRGDVTGKQEIVTAAFPEAVHAVSVCLGFEPTGTPRFAEGARWDFANGGLLDLLQLSSSIQIELVSKALADLEREEIRLGISPDEDPTSPVSISDETDDGAENSEPAGRDEPEVDTEGTVAGPRIVTESELCPILSVLTSLDWPVPFDSVPALFERLGWEKQRMRGGITNLPVNVNSVSAGELRNELAEVRFRISDTVTEPGIAKKAVASVFPDAVRLVSACLGFEPNGTIRSGKGARWVFPNGNVINVRPGDASVTLELWSKLLASIED